MNAEVRHAHECARDGLALVRLLRSRPGAPDEETMNRETAKVARALIECARATKSLPGESLAPFSTAAGKNYVDHLGEPHRSAHEAAIKVARDTYDLIRLVIGPCEENPRSRFGPEQIREFYGRWACSEFRRQQAFLRNLKAIEYGMEREAALVGIASRATPKRPRKRHRATDEIKPLTDKQSEAVYIVNECRGNIAEAARRLGKDPATVRQAFRTGMKKLGAIALDHKTTKMPTGKRGESSVSAEDDRRNI